MKHRIGVIVGRLYKNIDKTILNGIIEQAVTNGFEVYVFTVNDECANPKIMHGEENIFSMINFALLDGLIFVPYSFASGKYKEYAESILRSRCTVPVVRVGVENDTFESIWLDDAAEISEIVRHMIEVHGCRRMICLTGPKESMVSENRANGFRSAMNRAGLAYKETDIIYGDFWVVSGRKLAEELVNGERTMPDAIICGNDAMAISLCDALTEKGISVPNDVRITGYDGYVESRLHMPSVTTYISAKEQIGREAVCVLYRLITGTVMLPCRQTSGKLIRHESCGCGVQAESKEFLDFDFERFELGIFDNNLTAKMFDSETLDSFFSNTFMMLFTFMSEKRLNQERISINLCEDWDQPNIVSGQRIYRTSGYSGHMLCIHQYHGKKQFDLLNMYPFFSDADNYPVKIFNPLHFLDRCFGYICFETAGFIDDYNRDYIRFIREINNGLNFFCSHNQLKRALYRERLNNSRDNLTGLYLLQSNADMLDEIKERSNMYHIKTNGLVIVLIGLKDILNASGTEKLDQFILDFSSHLQKHCNTEESLFQINDNSFVIIGVSEHSETYCEELTKSLHRYLLNYNIIKSIGQVIAMHTCLIKAEEIENKSADDLIKMIETSAKNLYGEWLSLLSTDTHAADLIELRRNIYLNPMNDWNMEYCSEKLNVSRSYLHRIYTRLFGTSIADDVKTSRLNYAEHLLITTNHTLQTIAEECGLDYFNFMRVFKKERGVTPTEFRRTNHGI